MMHSWHQKLRHRLSVHY